MSKYAFRKGDMCSTLANVVTYGEFSKLAKKRKWTVEYLREKFRGQIEDPTDFFNRVLIGVYNKKYIGDSFIPYQSVLKLYWAYIEPTIASGKCTCGCGMPVFGKKRWASDACRKRNKRDPMEFTRIPKINTNIIEFSWGKNVDIAQDMGENRPR